MKAKPTTSKKRTEKDVLAYLRESIPRVNFNGDIYFKICSEACTMLKQARVEMKELIKSQTGTGKPPTEHTKYNNLSQKIRKQESLAIIFAAMCLEACIWDYAAVNTSQSLTKDYLEKLSLVGKWKVIPKLVNNNKSINIDSQAIALLKKLVKERNNIIHSKSKLLPNTYKEALMAILPKIKEISAEDAFGLIRLLLGGLEKVDKTNWWFFQMSIYRDSIKKAQESTVS